MNPLKWSHGKKVVALTALIWLGVILAYFTSWWWFLLACVSLFFWIPEQIKWGKELRGGSAP